MLSLPVPTPNNRLQIEVDDGGVLFILGRNGTGKSALVHFLHQHCRQSSGREVVYLPGSRPTYFDGDSLNMTANSRTQFETNSRTWDLSPDTRIRPISGTSRNERAIYDLQAAEIQYRIEAANQIESEGSSSPAIARLQSKSSPLDRVNRLLRQANLPVQTAISASELKATRGGNVYSISKMSDGERTALVLIADVIAAKRNAVFFIDEPELHLHRAIVVPLLSALISERPDCITIVSTHELALANDHPSSPVILVRDCSWSGSSPSAWLVDIFRNSESLPDELRVDIFGSRNTILFIEGAPSSRDQPLYALLFPKVSLRHRSSCVDVRRAVVGLRQVEQFHHVQAFGLVDNDGMDPEFQQTLLAEGIYALNVFSVESLYYSPEVLDAVAERQGATFKVDAAGLMNEARSRALTTLRQPGKIEHLAARIAERRMRDQMLGAIPDRNTMVRIDDAPISVSIPSPYPAVYAQAQALLQADDLDAIIAKFPIRETGILGDIAQSLRFIGHIDYEKAALALVGSDPALASSIRLKLGGLAGCLN